MSTLDARHMPPVTYRQLLDTGWSRHMIATALARGSLHRLARGWYEFGPASTDELVALRRGGRLGCLTGLRRYGVWVPPTEHPHLMVPRWSGSPGASIHHPQPRDAYWPRQAVTYDLEDCLRQAVRFHDAETALIVLESACNLKLVSKQTCERIIGECSARRAKQLARFEPLSESGTETRVRLFLVGLGYDVTSQALVNEIGRVDLLVGKSLVIECDSHAHHTGEQAYQKDRRRDLRACAGGYRVVRLTWEQVFLDWENTKKLLLLILRTRDNRRLPVSA